MIRILLLLLAFPVFAEEAPIDDNIIRTDSTTNSTVTTRSDTSTTLRVPSCVCYYAYYQHFKQRFVYFWSCGGCSDADSGYLYGFSDN